MNQKKKVATVTTTGALPDKRTDVKRPSAVQRDVVPTGSSEKSPTREIHDQSAIAAEIEIRSITVKAELRGRVTTSKSTVDQYAKLIDDGTKFPPVVVFAIDGEDVLADGYHRIAAAKQIGKTTILAERRQGTEEEALAYAVAANVKHGRPLTTADKRHNARLVLNKHPDWTDRLIAERVGMSPTTVGTLRSQLSNLDSCANRQGKDGRIRASKHPTRAGNAVVESRPFIGKAAIARVEKLLRRELAIWPKGERAKLGDFLYKFADEQCPENAAD